MANWVDLDQTWHSAGSDLDLHPWFMPSVNIIWVNIVIYAMQFTFDFIKHILLH